MFSSLKLRFVRQFSRKKNLDVQCQVLRCLKELWDHGLFIWQTRQAMYILVTLRHVRATIVVVENK